MGLMKALDKLQERIALTSDKNIDERCYALSEIWYYKERIAEFFTLDPEIQARIISDLAETAEVMKQWLNE